MSDGIRMRVQPVVWRTLADSDVPLRPTDIVRIAKAATGRELNPGSVTFAIASLLTQGRIVRVSHGRYVLVGRAVPIDPVSIIERVAAVLVSQGNRYPTAPREIAKIYARKFGEPVGVASLTYALARLRSDGRIKHVHQGGWIRA